MNNLPGLEEIKTSLQKLKINHELLTNNLLILLKAGDIPLKDLAKELDGCTVTAAAKYRDKKIVLPVRFYDKLLSFFLKRARANLNENNYWLLNLLFCIFHDKKIRENKELFESILSIENNKPVIPELSSKFIYFIPNLQNCISIDLFFTYDELIHVLESDMKLISYGGKRSIRYINLINTIQRNLKYIRILLEMTTTEMASKLSFSSKPLKDYSNFEDYSGKAVKQLIELNDVLVILNLIDNSSTNQKLLANFIELASSLPEEDTDFLNLEKLFRDYSLAVDNKMTKKTKDFIHNELIKIIDQSKTIL